LTGTLVDIGSCRLHFNQQGVAAPAVILEAGIAATSLSWWYVQPRVAGFARVCSYDRAGLGWSTACRAPRSTEQLVFELRTLLRNAQVAPPYVLVGHSFGGLLVRAYAYLHPEEVAGIVMVDPVSLIQWANGNDSELGRLARGVRLSRRGALLARIGVVRLALWLAAIGGRRLPNLIARASAGKGTSAIDRLIGEVRKLPPEIWPLVRAHWSRAKSFRAMAALLEALPTNARAALAMPLREDIPLTVLSASTATQAELAERESWARQSRRGRHIQLENCGHWLHLDVPDAVTAAIRELVELARA